MQRRSEMMEHVGRGCRSIRLTCQQVPQDLTVLIGEVVDPGDELSDALLKGCRARLFAPRSRVVAHDVAQRGDECSVVDPRLVAEELEQAPFGDLGAGSDL